MNLGLFNKLLRHRPSQHTPEWLTFLEICEMHLKKHGIENPVVVELGMWRGWQRQFYEQLLGAEYIGIDAANNRCTPDIHGNTHDPETMKALKEKLRGKPINILFIDASHRYKSVKKDFELYSPLCSDIVAIHDIELGRYQNIKTRGVWRFWDELKIRIYKNTEGHGNFLLLSIHQHRDVGDKSQMGIGMVIKR